MGIFLVEEEIYCPSPPPPKKKEHEKERKERNL
jgi:hypothetical protein